MRYMAHFSTVYRGQTHYVNVLFESESESYDQLQVLANKTLNEALKSDEARSLEWRLSDLRPFAPVTL